MDIHVAMELGKAFARGLRYRDSDPEMAEDKKTLARGRRNRGHGPANRSDSNRRHRFFGSAPDKQDRIWITVKGNHIPIENGKPASKIGKKIFAETNDDHTEKGKLVNERYEARKTELGVETTERNTRANSGDPKDQKWKGRSDRILGDVPVDPNAPVKRHEDLLGVQKIYDQKIEDGLKNIGPMMERLSKRLGFELKQKGYAIKGGESAARKFHNKYMGEKGMTAEQAAEAFPDLVRFTALAPHRRLVAMTNRLISEMDRQGYKVTKVDNKYIGNDPDPDPLLHGKPRTYKGIHLDCLSPNGTKFELQVHSPRAMEVKGENHPDYEDQRKMEKHSPEWEALQDKMRERTKRLFSPRNVRSLANASGSAVKVRPYRGQNRRK